MPGPLEGVKVLSFARNLAGPYCTMILCDLGAEVIKIEEPGRPPVRVGFSTAIFLLVPTWPGEEFPEHPARAPQKEIDALRTPW